MFSEYRGPAIEKCAEILIGLINCCVIAELKRHRKPLGQLLCARTEMIGKEKSCGLGRVSVQIEQGFIRAQGVHIVILKVDNP